MHEIIITVGPSSISHEIIHQLRKSGAHDYRINLSHSNPKSLQLYSDALSSAGVSYSIDTQGAQLRISKIVGSDQFCKGDQLKIFSDESISNYSGFALNHAEFFQQAHPGDILKVDFDGLTLRLDHIDKLESVASCTVLRSGPLTLNRAVDIQGKPMHLDCLTKFDKQAISKYCNKGIKSIYLSFAKSYNDIQICQQLIDEACTDKTIKPRLIAKIESRQGILNLREIAHSVDGILIDRGDLSREISISRIPLATKAILDVCLKLKTPCFVATNILDSMMSNQLPSRAEISDLFNLFSSGVSGIVLAAEVAIGKHPVESVQVVTHMSKIYQADLDQTLPFLPGSDLFSKLNGPLGSWL